LQPDLLSAEEFLSSDGSDETNCLMLDFMMPGMSGPEPQPELKLRSRIMPIVFITAGTRGMIRATGLEWGAAKCLIRPFGDTDLLDALTSALQAN
jgi:FixJ family two-component response regulator